MIIGKIWRAVSAQVNKFANYFWGSDPIAALQYEYDLAVEQLKDGRLGLESQRALVERANSQLANARSKYANLETRVKALLTAGQREQAAKYALDMQKVKQDLADYEAQYSQHEQVYNNNLAKIKNANEKLAKIREKINKYDAELKMSKAEAEMAHLAQDFNFDVTTDFGKIEQAIQEKIGLNKAKAKVAADISSEGLEEIKAEEDMQKVMAEQALKDFEAQLGLAKPETANVSQSTKELGPAVLKQTS